ncbi:site-specific integrase [Sphingopyxis indica]|uniref:tyrosine-type recombinase/integrase n=1 Tax=Sphingopyxis indica TaxID=436663 RepID=UPI0029390FF6|nr:site-specific integrase [Sphingopyxis indica]WOF43546.1 site-specific integrase [Sphingopyxis indica]
MSRPRAEPRLEIDRKDPGGNFYIYWTEGGRSREKSTGTRDRREAELFRATWLIARHKPKGPRDPAEVLIAETLNNYMLKRMPKVADKERIQNAVSAMLPFWRNRYVSEVTEGSCDDYLVWRNRATETMRRELGVLAAAINRAFRDGLISRTVTVFRPAPSEGRIRFLECHEAVKLVRAASRVDRAAGHLPLFLIIGMLTGQRKEAILSLKWADIDFERGYIDWNPAGRRRTKKERPRTTIPKRLVKQLKRRRRKYPQDEYVVTYQGHPIKDIKNSFHAAVALADIPTTGHRKVVPHTLRHTCATWLMQKGIDKHEACGFLGMTRETLEKNYGHHHPNYQTSARDAF